VRPANVRRPEMHPAAACPEAYSAAVPAKATVPAATVSTPMPAKARPVSAAMPSATMSPAAATMSPAAAMPTATAAAAAGICFECEKRHDEQQHRGQASAGRHYPLHCALGSDAPCRRLSLAIRTKSF
jgi:hypothetical protein